MRGKSGGHVPVPPSCFQFSDHAALTTKGGGVGEGGLPVHHAFTCHVLSICVEKDNKSNRSREGGSDVATVVT